MKRRLLAQRLIECLNEKIRHQLNFSNTLVLSVVLKGLPIAYSLAKMNDVVENFVPLVAQRQIYMQHQIESYFPSLQWKAYFSEKLKMLSNILIVDDVVNTGFTKQKVESIVSSLNQQQDNILSQRFAALVLNRKNLANRNFVSLNDFYAMAVNASDVECDWGMITVPIRDLPIEAARERCEEYLQRYWQKENRWITVTY